MNPEPLIGPVAAPGLHLMSFNIRRRLGALAWPAADRWVTRAPRLRALLAAEQPSLLAAQEVLPSQLELLKDALGLSYQHVGHGRGADSQGEGCPIVYDATRLELREWSQLALSDSPDVAGSTSWGNSVPRIVVRAAFGDAATGAGFVVLNTHLDPFSSRSRIRAAEQIRAWAARESSPVIVTGDLNSRPDSRAVAALLGTDTLRDAWDAAHTRLTPEWGTYGGYRPPRANGARIDAVMVSPGVRVNRIGINAEQVDGGWPSDHLPVQAVVCFPETGGAA